jgi:hypothetical protein
MDAREYSLEHLLLEITAENVHPETDVGPSVVAEWSLPKISEFLGISIYMYYQEHGLPHFHASYGSDEALISIADFAVLDGWLSPRSPPGRRMGEPSSGRPSDELGACTQTPAARAHSSFGVGCRNEANHQS